MSAHIAAPAQKSQAAALASAALFLFFLAASAAWALSRQEQPTQLPQRGSIQAERYEIDVSFQPEKGFLHARAAVTLRVLPPPPPEKSRVFQAIEFELSPHLKILEVTDAQARKLEFDRSGRLGSPKLLVRLAELFSVPLEATTGITLTITFTYEGVLPSGPLDYISKDGILLRDESRWYPAVDLSSFTDNDITIQAPPNWLTRSSGHFVCAPEELAHCSHWATGNRTSSRAIVATPSNLSLCDSRKVSKPNIEGVSFHTNACFPPANARAAELMDDTAFDITRYYAYLLGLRSDFAQAPVGELHFRGLGIFQGFPGQRGAIGYSAPGFLVVSEDAVKYYGYPGFAPEFLPHEIAHQWFPIEVTLARQEDGWLAESLAEYLAWRYLQEKNPEQARLMVARAMRDALAPDPLRPLSLGLRLFALENNEVTRATLYQRGMLVFRTLETVIDRERVDRALREYYKRYAGKPASIADFRKICEEISGRDLGWFFDYFIQGAEIPEIQIRRTPSAAPNEVSGEIVVKNVPPNFQVRVEMRAETLGGPVDHSVATRGEVTPFTITTPQPATRLILDPDQRLLRWTEAARRNRAQRALLAQLGDLERAGRFTPAVELCERALALDPENSVSNEQMIRFALGRLRYRQGQFPAALAEFGKVQSVSSLDPMESDFNRAWSHVYRARIQKRSGHLLAARAEAQAGLAMKSPALESRVAWPETPARETTAARQLQALAK